MRIWQEILELMNKSCFSTGADNVWKEYVGRRVEKEFDKIYKGTIVYFWVTKRHKYINAHILYDDRDEEDRNWDQFKKDKIKFIDEPHVDAAATMDASAEPEANTDAEAEEAEPGANADAEAEEAEPGAKENAEADRGAKENADADAEEVEHIAQLDAEIEEVERKAKVAKRKGRKEGVQQKKIKISHHDFDNFSIVEGQEFSNEEYVMAKELLKAKYYCIHNINRKSRSYHQNKGFTRTGVDYYYYDCKDRIRIGCPFEVKFLIDRTGKKATVVEARLVHEEGCSTIGGSNPAYHIE